MSRPWIFLANLLVMLCLVGFQAPRPCHGDGAGHACHATTCTCTTTCSCQVGHQKVRDLVAALHGRRACFQGDDPAQAAAEQMVAAALGCHLEEAAHFAAPEAGPGPALVAAPGPGWSPATGAARAGAPAGNPPTGPPAATFRPPWLRA
jgi:hypothetical protein